MFDYIQLGDTLAARGDYERAEGKDLQAKSLATKTYFEEGRKDAIDALEAIYASRDKAEAADTREAKAKAFYAMALEKYQELGIPPMRN